MILFAKERRHLPQKSHPILCCGRNLTEADAPSTYTNKNSTSFHQVGLSAQGLYRNKGLVRWSLSVGLILVKPFLPQELNMQYKSNGWLLHIKKISHDTQWIPIRYSLGIMGKYDDGLLQKCNAHLHKHYIFQKMHWLFYVR